MENIFCRTPRMFGMKQEPAVFHESCIRSAVLTSLRRKRKTEHVRRRGYSPPVLSNDTLHLFVHHTREFTSTKRSAGYSTDNNVTLDTVQCAYTIHIYKSTFARSADRLRLLSPCLSFSRTLFLVLSRSLAPFSLLAPLKSELSFSRFFELSLVT